MEKTNSTSLVRTRSDQLVETIAAAMAPMKSPVSPSDNAVGVLENGSALSRKSSRRLAMPSPGRSSTSGKNTHIRKWSSAQMKFDIDDVNSGAALSRASSASLGLSFSFTGFNMPDEIADSKPYSDDDIPEDIEAGMCKKKIHTEPTLPIYLKVTYYTRGDGDLAKRSTRPI